MPTVLRKKYIVVKLRLFNSCLKYDFIMCVRISSRLLVKPKVVRLYII